MEEHGYIIGRLIKIYVQKILRYAKLRLFNAIRLPISIENLRGYPMITSGFGAFQTGDLSNKHYIDVIKTIDKKAADILTLIVLISIVNKTVMYSPRVLVR